MIRFLFILLMISTAGRGFAQPEAEIKKIAQELQAALKSLGTMAAVPKLDAAALKKVQLPSASAAAVLDTFYRWTGKDRNETISWKVNLKNFPLGTSPSVIVQYHAAFNTLLDSLYPNSRIASTSTTSIIQRKLSNNSVYTDFSTSDKNEQFNTVVFYFAIQRQTPNFFEIMRDSVKQQFYRAAGRAMNNREIIAAQKRFVKAIDQQRFDGYLSNDIYLEALQEKGAANADVAAALILDYPFFIKEPGRMTDLVNADVKAEVQARAKKIVEDYNAYMQQATATTLQPGTTTTPSSKNNKSYANPCDEEMDGLKYKVGEFVVQGGKAAEVTAYDCATDKYMIAWVDKTKNKAVVEIVMKDVLTNSYQKGNAQHDLPFICYACKGFGYVLEAETKRMFNNPPGTLTVEYATGKTLKIGCGTCKGKGHTKG